MEHKYSPVELVAEISFFEGSEALKKEVASIVKFPENKTPDVLFFSGIFVSSGENLNKAYFMPSELVKSFDTIANKPLDLEHKEVEIVGHIYSAAFADKNGAKVEISQLKEMAAIEIEKMELDVVIAGILYKNRFPELADEVKNNKWKLSMETYYEDFDVKVGNTILSRKEAEALGIATENVLGKVAKLLKQGKEIAKGSITRVLRGLIFSGCGLVQNPANPRSVILETAAKKKEAENMDEIVIELEPVAEPVKGDKDMKKEGADVRDSTSPADVSGGPGAYDIRTQTSVGICVSYKRRVIDATFEGPDAKVLHEDWCALYEQGCTSPSRGADHPKCLRNTVAKTAKSYVEAKLKKLDKEDKRGDLLVQLKSLLD